MDEHLGKVIGDDKDRKDHPEALDHVDKSEISSSWNKGSSAFGDSAYSSLGHSAYSSTHAHVQHDIKNKNPSSNPSSKSSGLSGYKAQLASQLEDASGSKDKSLVKNFRNIKQPQPFSEERDTKAANIATLSKALCYIDQLKISKARKLDNKHENIDTNDSSQFGISQTTKVGFGSTETSRKSGGSQEYLSSKDVQSEERADSEGFCVAVSLQDGMVLHSTKTVSSILGYPKDMWIGRSFIDFVHPKDREVFIGQVTKNVSLPANNISEGEKQNPEKNVSSQSESFFCRIRRYNSLKSGFAVKERKTKYSSFKLCICFSEVDTEKSENESIRALGIRIYLFITAIPLQPAYTTSNQEGPIKLKSGQDFFISKFSSSCLFTYLDENSISFLGHFPQDLQGTDIFEQIHPDDLQVIKDSFEKIMSRKLFKSQPYRLKTRNGDFIHVTTVWSCFINPWSQQLEFIHGKHTVIKGPNNTNVFLDSPNTDKKIQDTENEENQNETIQREIRMILKNTSQRYVLSDCISGSSIKTKNELSSFMGTLLQEVTKTENIELTRAALAEKVVIGNISPHRSDSSETPPSYTQLTYNENLTRFFNSQPKTMSEKDMLTGFVYSPPSYEDNMKEPPDRKTKERNSNKKKESGSGHVEDGGRSAGGSGHGSGEQHGSGTGQTVSGSGEDNAKNSSSLQIGLSAGHIQPGGEECMLSQDGCTSGSGSRLGSGSREGIEDAYKPPALTEDLLIKHNQDMEKSMLTKFKEAKRIGENRFLKAGTRNKAVPESGSKKVSKNIVDHKEKKRESGTRKHPLKTDPKINLPDGIKTGNPRPLTFNDFHLSSNEMIMPVKIHDKDGNVTYHPTGQIVQGTLANGTFQNFIQVPAMYLPIADPASMPSLMVPDQVPMGLVVSGSSRSFIPINIGNPSQGFETKGAETKVSDSESDSWRKGTPPQPKLPNCLAVNSCMELLQHQDIIQEKSPGKENKHIRVQSRDGLNQTSIKAEPGSALESNASAGESIKERPKSLGRKSEKVVATAVTNECSSSQSLYSFIQSTDEIEPTGFTTPISSPVSTEDSKVLSPRLVARPLLSEPFWNQNVKINSYLLKRYQLKQRDMEDVLREDRTKFLKMEQPAAVDEQLAVTLMSFFNLKTYFKRLFILGNVGRP